jgi:putative flippase GtrA
MWPNIFAYIRNHKWQLIRFCIVGVATFALNLTLVWLFYGKAGLDYRIAVTCAYVVTVGAHFLLNRSFTYRQADGAVGPDAVKYGIMLIANYLITLGITTATVELLGLTPYFGIIFSIFVTAFSSFLLMKHFVFVRKRGVK